MRRFCMDSGQITIIPKPEWSGDFWGIPSLFTTIWGNSQPAGLGRYNLPRWIIYPRKNHQKFLVGLVPSLQPATTAPGDVSENFWQEISDHPTEGSLWIFFWPRAVARCFYYYYFFSEAIYFFQNSELFKSPKNFRYLYMEVWNTVKHNMYVKQIIPGNSESLFYSLSSSISLLQTSYFWWFFTMNTKKIDQFRNLILITLPSIVMVQRKRGVPPIVLIPFENTTPSSTEPWFMRERVDNLIVCVPVSPSPILRSGPLPIIHGVILRETPHTPGAYPRHPQTPKWKEFLHKLLVGGLGYAPGVCW